MKPLVQKQLSIDSILVNYYSSTGNSRKGRVTYVFLHGWRSDGTIWFDITERMGGAELYCLDLPGFGKSSTPNRAMTLDDYAEIVDIFIKKLKLKNVVLVGHSFGGRVAIKVAATRPGIVERLVLVNSAGFASPKGKKTALKIVAKGVKPFFKPHFMQPLKRRIYATMGAEDYVATPELKDTFVKVVGEDLSEDMRSIELPTLLVWGENDKETPLDMAHRMNSLISKSRLEVLKDAGHFSFLDQTQQFIELLNA